MAQTKGAGHRRIYPTLSQDLKYHQHRPAKLVNRQTAKPFGHPQEPFDLSGEVQPGGLSDAAAA